MAKYCHDRINEEMYRVAAEILRTVKDPRLNQAVVSVTGAEVSPESDLYSVGMVLYWALNARRLPFVPLPPTAGSAAREGSAGCADFAARGGAAALYGCCACLSVLGVSVWAQLRLFAGAAYRPRLLVFSRAVHLVLLQLLVRVCAQLLPGSVTACSTLAARVLPVFRLPPDAAAAGFVFLCAALYKVRQSLYNK